MLENDNVLTVGQLINEDLEKAYFFPTFGSPFCEKSRFLNSEKYRIYYWPPISFTYREIFCPQTFFCTAGDEIPTLTDHPPPEFLKQHWNTWLPIFPLAKYVSIDDGLNDDNVPIVTCCAFEGIPKNKHSVDPDVLYKLQLKSSIPEIGVPCPRYMDENSVDFPCVIKADLSYDGVSTLSANNSNELFGLVQEMREKRDWKDKIIYQELLQGINRVLSYIFYLKKSGEVVWLGTNQAVFHGFQWESLTFDWNKQEEERNLVYDEFVIPIKDYLHKHGYFGFVNFELAVTDHGRYLVDLNPRLPGEVQHHLMASYMASMGFTYSSIKSIDPAEQNTLRAQKLVQDANQLNQSHSDKGRIVVVAAVDVDVGGCENRLSIFGKTREDVDALFQRIKYFSTPENN